MERRPSEQEIIYRFIGEPLRQPQPGEPPPAPNNIPWPRAQIYRDPPRSGS
jgi:hypothetical protein